VRPVGAAGSQVGPTAKGWARCHLGQHELPRRHLQQRRRRELLGSPVGRLLPAEPWPGTLMGTAGLLLDGPAAFGRRAPVTSVRDRWSRPCAPNAGQRRAGAQRSRAARRCLADAGALGREQRDASWEVVSASNLSASMSPFRRKHTCCTASCSLRGSLLGPPRREGVAGRWRCSASSSRPSAAGANRSQGWFAKTRTQGP
jgi:hypothetical protein